jgi:hypothetical protein
VRGTCRVCRHPRVEEIDRDLTEGKFPLRVLAGKYGPSAASLVHHRSHYVLPVLVLKYAESSPGAVPVQARLAVESLARAATAPGTEGVEAAYYLLNLIIYLAESPPSISRKFPP